MTIIQALEWSRDTGLSVSSSSNSGWVRYGDDFIFKLSGKALLATDWQSTDDYVSQLTNGKYAHVESETE